MSTLYISSPVNALVEGIFRENKTIANLLQHGNHGLGTFNDLDGELVLKDGEVFQLDVDGHAHAVASDRGTPFGCVTQFSARSVRHCWPEGLAYEGFLAFLDTRLSSPNYAYAIRIEGSFQSVKTRSVPRQAAYHPLVEAADEQKESQFENVAGTLIGFWTPRFLSSIAVPGYHFHFLTADQRSGGHLLGCVPVDVQVAVQEIHHIRLDLPSTQDFSQADFTRNTNQDLERAEHAR